MVNGLQTTLTNDSCTTSNEADIPQQTIQGTKITKQPTNHCNFHVLTTNHITTKLTNPNHDETHKYHHLTTTLLDSEDDCCSGSRNVSHQQVFLKNTLTRAITQNKL